MLHEEFQAASNGNEQIAATGLVGREIVLEVIEIKWNARAAVVGRTTTVQELLANNNPRLERRGSTMNAARVSAIAESCLESEGSLALYLKAIYAKSGSRGENKSRKTRWGSNSSASEYSVSQCDSSDFGGFEDSDSSRNSSSQEDNCKSGRRRKEKWHSDVARLPHRTGEVQIESASEHYPALPRVPIYIYYRYETDKVKDLLRRLCVEMSDLGFIVIFDFLARVLTEGDIFGKSEGQASIALSHLLSGFCVEQYGAILASLTAHEGRVT